jgi:superoxide reductase
MVKEKYEIWRCNICGNIVEVLYSGNGPLVCCGQDMELMAEKTNDAGMEKHVPVVEVNGDKVAVKVGEVPHPMESGHYIQWIEIIREVGNSIHYLSPGDKPEAEFQAVGNIIKVRIYCNIHGLWKKET